MPPCPGKNGKKPYLCFDAPSDLRERDSILVCGKGGGCAAAEKGPNGVEACCAVLICLNIILGGDALLGAGAEEEEEEEEEESAPNANGAVETG